MKRDRDKDMFEHLRYLEIHKKEIDVKRLSSIIKKRLTDLYLPLIVENDGRLTVVFSSGEVFDIFIKRRN